MPDNRAMEDLPVSEEVTIPGAELQISFARSGGPGGQNVNKVESKVELRWNPGLTAVLAPADRARLLERLTTKLTSAGELVVTSSRTRDQLRNREDARSKLSSIVGQALVRPKTRRKTKPKAGAVERRLQQKKQRGRVKQERQAPEV